VVVAPWEFKGGLDEGVSLGHIDVQENVTGDGRFRLAAWGPRFWVGGLGPRLGDAPHLYVFKEGFRSLLLRNAKESLPWKAAPHLLRAIDRQRAALVALGVKTRVRSLAELDVRHHDVTPTCGSVVALVGNTTL
jgi:hypothetical protein